MLRDCAYRRERVSIIGTVLSGPVDNALFVRERKEYINFGDLMVRSYKACSFKTMHILNETDILYV